MFQEYRNLLSDRAFDELIHARRNNEFKDVENPADGVTYPRICDDIPDIVVQEVEFLAQQPVNYLFMREMPEGVTVPHEAHTDNSMGRTSMMLYLEDGPGGTAFLRHRVLGIHYAPAVQNLVDLIMEDTNNRDAWVVNQICKQERNKACIFDAGFIHRAEPLGGYGEGKYARCVLTGFFG